MVGVILISHGSLADAFLSAAQEILGIVEGVESICLPKLPDEGHVLDAIQKARRLTEKGDGVLILTDMFGGTPCNLCFSLLEEKQVEVLTGMNLPMILKILSSRENSSLTELARIAMDCGRENIYLARELLEKRAKHA